MKHIAAGLGALLLLAPAAHAQRGVADPFIWLEDIDSARSMDWVKQQNAASAARLEGDPRYAPMLAQARVIFTATDRIAQPTFRAGGVDNFWQDAANPHGVWRRTRLENYATGEPRWTPLLDVDALAKAEGRNWFWKGATCLRPAQTTCLVRLSNGGGDAVELREFDAAAAKFVEGGFRLPEGKQSADWLDRDSWVVSRAWTPEEVTRSGYAYVVKTVDRAGKATEIFRGKPSDVSVQPTVLRGDGGRVDAILVRRGVTFFESEHSLVGPGAPVRIPLPLKASYQAYLKGQVLFTLQEAWGGFGAGALVAYDLAALKADAQAAKPRLIFQPGPRQAIQQVDSTNSRLVVVMLDEVKGAVDVYNPDAGWKAGRLDLPKDANITLVDAEGDGERMFLNVESFLEPTTLHLGNARTGGTAQVRALPARFDPGKHVVEQFWATSSDGAKIPYFLVRPKDARKNGSTPTLMYGYGGFEVAKPPLYLPEMGKLWLERGGAYVIANIRGGGEFGPAWHQSVLREKRQLAFDDFAAVAKDLSARKITSPRRLGIYGRSNGGVLTTVSMTQHPELWNAVVVESPLVDMLRYHKLSAGASWIGEYGDPDVPVDRAFIAKYSGYQALKAGAKYPEAYITTNTRDDRVHPGHARKYAARLQQLGVPYLYFEQTFGGHANDADPELNAGRWARHYVYLAQKLMD